MKPTLSIEESEHRFKASVTFDRWDGTRAQFAYRIEADGVVVEGTDLRAPNDYAAEALESLLDFLGAFAEAQRYPDSDNQNLFDGALIPFADAVDPDYFWMLRQEVQRDAV